MEVQYKSRNGQLAFKISGEVKEIFKGIAEIQEVFEASPQCGLCGGTDHVLRVRVVDDNEFYEMVCRSQNEHGYTCNARFQFGQNKKGGGLFPKRKDKDGNYFHGWERYTKPASGSAKSGDWE